MKTNLSYQYYIAGNEYINGNLTEDRINFKRKLSDFTVENSKIHGIDFKNFLIHPLVTEDTKFTLKTTYPGLLTGAGYSHPALNTLKKEITNDVSDFNLGFFFDHTTGMPIIPGSSVKGILKSVFPQNKFVKMKERLDYIKDLFIMLELNVEIANRIDDKNWEEIFFGELHKRKHIFCDAYVEEIPQDGKIFEDDYITPHTKGIFKEPKPIRFLKIAPGIKITFQFVLCEYSFNDTLKLKKGDLAKVFHQILIDFGIGAKRNVGYGQLK